MTGLQIALIVIAGIVVIVLIISFVFSSMVIHSARQKIYRSPKDFDMDFDEIKYKSTDGIELEGWYIKGNSEIEKTVIMAHPWTFNRHGFSRKRQKLPLFKTDVNVLPMAKALNEKGYSVLMFDFRNHGISGKGLTGIGLTEYQGILGAVEYVNKRTENKANVGFVSLCMGANSTIIALSKGKDTETLNNVKFMVAVQPISAEVFISNFMRAQYTSLSLFLVPIVNKICQMRGGFPFSEMSPKEYAKDIKVPAMYVQAETDPWTNLDDIKSFYENTPTEKEFWMLTGKMKRFDTYNYIGEHPQKILEFVGKYF